MPDDMHIAASRIAAMLRDAASLVAGDPDGARTRLDTVSAMLGALQSPAPDSSEMVRVLAPWQARRVEAFIRAHLDEPIRIQALAEHTRLSVSYFFRAFRGSFGMAPHAFVMRCRTDRAMQLLVEGDEPIAQIAIACGFADQAHFSRAFARRMGSPPGVWRRLQRGAVSLAVD
jgi:AraC-like DNA-binding protein